MGEGYTNSMAYYTCGKCRFTFERKGAVDSCPDCAHPNVVEATGEDITQFLYNQAEFAESDKP